MSAEFKSALARGLLHAGLVAAMTFFTLWPTHIELKELISATVIPAITVLGTRFIGEGWYDTAKNGRMPDGDKKP